MRYLLCLLIFLAGCEAPAETPAPLPVVPTIEPAWTTFTPVRAVRDLGPVLTDVESHLPQGHPYANPGDIVNWVHEGSHGIASELRQVYGYAAFYVLNDRAVRITEPAITLSQVAREVPASLRGFNYRLYFVQQLADWNEHPTYPFDEWTAYTNGAEARLRRNIPDRDDTVRFCMEFMPYSICVAKAAHDAGLPDDPQMKAFIQWQAARCIRLGAEIKLTPPNMMSADAESLRDFCHLYFGALWTASNLGF